MASARKLIGSTNPLQAEPGTIRGDLAVQTGRYTLDAWYLMSYLYMMKFHFVAYKCLFTLDSN